MSLFSFRALRASVLLLAPLALVSVQPCTALAVSGPFSPSIDHSTKHFAPVHSSSVHIDHHTRVVAAVAPSNTSAPYAHRRVASRSPSSAATGSTDLSQLLQYHDVMSGCLSNLRMRIYALMSHPFIDYISCFAERRSFRSLLLIEGYQLHDFVSKRIPGFPGTPWSDAER